MQFSQENFSTNNEPKFSSPEEEIRYLREEISRRQEATKNFGERIKKEDHARDVIREHLSRPNPLPDYYGVSSYDKKKLLDGLKERETDEQVSDLVSIMLDKGIHTTISLVKESRNKEVESDFHRFLVNYLLIPHDKDIESGLSKTDWKALHMKLFEIIPPENKDNKTGGGQEEQKTNEQYISFMEQFFASMLGISSDIQNKDNNYYTLELAKPNHSNQISFYVGVMNEVADLFEKNFLALFPDVTVKLQKDDYNVFSENGFQLSAYSSAVKTSALPFKTYEEIKGADSISQIMNAFTKLAKDGEGASMQIVVRPAGERFFKKYSSMIDSLRKGSSLKRILEQDSFFKDFMNNLGDMGKTKEDFDKEKDKNKNKLENQTAEKYITKKIESTIVDTNIRLVVNGPTLERAKSILADIASTFKQYTEADGNAMQFKMYDGKRSNEEIHNFIYRYWLENESLPLNFKELATIYHMPIYVKNYSQLKKVSSANAPAPLDLPQSGLFLGINEYRGITTKIFIPEADRLRHLYVIGQTGTGKSVMLVNSIIQDIVNGHGCCFIDPHGEDVLKVLGNIPRERWDDVIYFDPADSECPMGLNMLEFDPRRPEMKQFVIDELFGIFKKLFAESSPESMGPAFEQYFRNSAALVMQHPESGCTLFDISRVLSDADYRDYKLAKSKNPIINQFFKNALATSGDQGFENYVPYITNKFDIFTSNEIMRPIIGQEKSSFNITDIMDNKKIFLVNLSKGRLGDINANLIGLILVGKFLMAALGRENPSEKPPFYLYLDEFQNIATKSISAILSEARKYKLSLTLAHQYIKQLPEDIKGAIFGNVGSKLVFRISEEDAKFLESSFSPVFTASDIMKIENLNAYASLLINGYPQKPFNIKECFFNNIDSPFAPKPNPEIIELLKKMSKEKYGRSREEVENEIMQKFNFE